MIYQCQHCHTITVMGGLCVYCGKGLEAVVPEVITAERGLVAGELES